jgi:apolipoprotein N-acyltransferase
MIALIAGGLMPLGLAPFHWWPLALLSLALFCHLISSASSRQVFFRSLAYGTGLFGVGVSWVFISIHVHGGESILISFTLTALLVILLAVLFALPFSLYGRIHCAGTVKTLLVFPALWVATEWFRGWIFTGFPWLYLGYSFTDTWLAGWAPLGGVLLLSLIAAFSAASLVVLSNQPAMRLKSSAGVALAACLWAGGQPLNTIAWTQPEGESLSLAMVQPALTPSQKWNNDILYDILVQLRQQSAGLWGVDLLIWPESAIPVPPEDVQPYIDFLDNLSIETDTTLITGIPLFRQGKWYNSIILLGADEGAYSKRHLVPFGEYIPLESVLRGLIAFFDRPMSSFSPGAPVQAPLVAKGANLASAICYEIVFQDLVAASATDANIILTLSNDVWFGDSIAPHQHLQMARLRAIENRKPVVRSTNDGISAVIDHRGKVTARAPQFEVTTLTGTVTPYAGTTPFNHWRSWPVVLFSITVLAGGLFLPGKKLPVKP